MSFTPVDFFAVDGATYPIYTNTTFAAVYESSTNKTWVVWEGWNGSHRIVRVRVYNHTIGRWHNAVTIAISPLTDDDHGAPSLCRDHQGYWHVFFGAHLNQSAGVYHYATTGVDDWNVWSAQTVINPSSLGISYPHGVMQGSVMYLYYRKGDYGVVDDTPLAVIHTTALSGGVATWSSPTVLADFSSDSRWYQGPAIVHPTHTTEVHFVGTKANRLDTTRNDVFYLIHDTSDNSVKNFDKSVSTASGSLPVNLSNLNASYRIFTNSGSGDIPGLVFDEDGHPHVLYMDGTGTSRGVYHIAWFGTGGFSSPTQLGTSNSRYSEFCISRGLSNTVQAYWTEADSVPHSDGGNLKTASRSAGSGGSWGSAQPLLTVLPGGKPINDPQAVKDGHADLRVVVFETAVASNGVDASSLDVDAGGLKGYGWGDNGFVKENPLMTAYSRKITLASHPSSTLTNFPVLVSITDPSLKAISSGGGVRSPNGYDILFAADLANATPYYWEMESYDGTSGTVVAWVLVPSVSSSVDTVFYMLWGDASISSFQSTPSAVWDANYKAVWHLGSSGGSLSVADSTAGANNGTNHSASAVSGKIGSSANFNGTSQYIDLGNNANLKVSLPATISFWVNKNASYNAAVNDTWFNNNSLYGAGHNYGGLYIGDDGAGHIEATFGDNAGTASAHRRTKIGTTALANSTDYFITVVFRGAGDETIYINGADDGGSYSGTGGALAYGAFNGTIGATQGSSVSDFYFGKIDEVRISNIERSAAWVGAEYASQNNPVTFLALGPVIGPPPRARAHTSLRLGLRAA